VRARATLQRGRTAGNEDERIRIWQHQSTGCEGNRLPTTAATGSSESWRGQTTKATDKSGRTMTTTTA
jgi:hypothetical protein